MIVVESRSAEREALLDIQELLCGVAARGSPHRLAAVQYTETRQHLLQSGIRNELPGFLVQCVSLFKFHEFITLYHARVEARVAFIEDAFAACMSRPDTRRGDTAFNDFDF